MRPVRGMSYDQDDSIMYLADLKNLKKELQEESNKNDPEDEKIEVREDDGVLQLLQDESLSLSNGPKGVDELKRDMDFLNEKSSKLEQFSLSFVGELSLLHFGNNCVCITFNEILPLGGMILKRTIHSRSFCKDCINYFTSKDGSKTQSKNLLISMREFKKGALVDPSEPANKMFAIAEDLFRQKRNGMQTNTLSDLVFEEVKKQIPDVITCHLKIILTRFITTRTHWNLTRESQQDIKTNKRITKSSAEGSASMKAKYTCK